MKVFIAARGLNDTECPICGARLANRASLCPRSQAHDEKSRCPWQPGYWADGRFWSAILKEYDLPIEEIARLKACADLVVVDETMMLEERQRAQVARK